MSTPHLVIAGCGHAHLDILERLPLLTAAGIRVTVAAPEPFWYSGMGPGLLSGRYRAEEDRVDVEHHVRAAGAGFVRSELTGIHADRNEVTLADGSTLAYDALSLNLGSGIDVAPFAQARIPVVPVKPVRHYLELRDRLHASDAGPIQIVVIGGGPAGIETAANLAVAGGDPPPAITVIDRHEKPLSSWGDTGSRVAAHRLEALGIPFAGGRRVRVEEDGAIRLDDGSTVSADILVVATGIHPSPLPGSSGAAATDRNELIVNDYLQSISHPNLFGGGDCIHLQSHPLDKVGVYAVRQGPVLADNIESYLFGRPLRPFRPQKHYLLILNLGDGQGLLAWRGFSLHGTWVFRLKERLDRGFMQRYRRLRIDA